MREEIDKVMRASGLIGADEAAGAEGKEAEAKA
jgi:hypothetical protein